jgi:hypothetical protein
MGIFGRDTRANVQLAPDLRALRWEHQTNKARSQVHKSRMLIHFFCLFSVPLPLLSFSLFPILFYSISIALYLVSVFLGKLWANGHCGHYLTAALLLDACWPVCVDILYDQNKTSPTGTNNFCLHTNGLYPSSFAFPLFRNTGALV